MDKKFLPKNEPVKRYLPAQLVKAADRWYIKFYQTNPITGEYNKHKPTYNLNRIKDLRTRMKYANEKIAEINKLLPQGFPYFEPEILTDKEITPVVEAVQAACMIKCADLGTRARQAYAGWVNLFSEWAKLKKLETLPVCKFDKERAVEFMDWLTLYKKYAPKTWNNQHILARSLFYVLKERGYVSENQFVGLKKKKVVSKPRRAFTKEEQRIVAQRIWEVNPFLHFGLVLQYFGHMRPVEIRRLQVMDLDFESDMVHLAAPKSKKNNLQRHMTMPAGLLRRYAPLLEGYAGHLLVFGRGFSPGLSPMGHNAMNRAHNRVLEQLKKEGLLTDTEKLTWYSWKNTGLTDMSDVLPLPEVQAQAGHVDPKTTMIYYERKFVRPGYRDWKVEL